MKRFSDGGGYGGQGQQGPGNYKRFRGGPDDVEIRLLIPSRVAGSIIGKSGGNIARLRKDFKASVTVPDCPGPERILTVFAELENGLKVIEEVLPALDEVRQKFQQNQRGGRGDNQNGNKNDDYDIRLIVHQSQAGCIIGKEGLKIKELRDKTGAKIKIYSNCCPQSTDRIAQIFGSGETSINCIREIIELLKTAPVKGMDNPYDPFNYDDYCPEQYGGYGGMNMGGRGGGGGGGGRFNGPPGGFSRGGGRFNDGPGGGFGSDGGYGQGGGYNNSFYDGPMGGGGGFGPPGDMAGPGMGGGPGARNSTQVTIPKDMAGAIIGKSGQRIRKIRVDSGAGITIDEPLPGSNDRIITITGSPNQIQMAQYLLQQSVREYGNA